MKKALITDIQKFCVHDGPGIRTTVFFQGCSLRCKWCQNPETISIKPVLLYNKELCTGCGSCIVSCPTGAISMADEGYVVTDYDKCYLCGECEGACVFLARKMSSHEYTVDEVFKEVIKDKVVFQNSGGGLTVSGGEPLLHEDFIVELLTKIKNEGISTAVETCGMVKYEAIEKVAKLVDTFLFDFKAFSEDIHEKWTGVSNKKIKENLKKLCDIHDNIVIRIPLIPGVNDSTEEFTKMMQFVSTLRNINSVHILPFHQLGSNKYELAGMEYSLKDLKEDNEENVEKCKKIAEEFGLRTNLGGAGFKNDKKTNHAVIKMQESFIYE